MANKHMPYDLAQMQSLPLEAKERMTKLRLDQWFTHWDGEVYVSFSGGKDSTVLADLCARYCQEYKYTLYLLFVNTGLEYPEIQRFVKEYAERLRKVYEIEVVLDIVRPELRFDEVIKKYGYPVVSKAVSHIHKAAKRNKNSYSYQLMVGTAKDKQGRKSLFNVEKWKFLLDAPFDILDKCCDVMKKRPAKQYEKRTGRKPILGTMASESRLRLTQWMKHGCNGFDKNNPSSQPLSFWTEQDILHYIKKYDLPYCSVYGDIVVDNGDEAPEQINIIDYLQCWDEQDKLKTTGCFRTGCIFCMFGCHLDDDPNRFQQLKKTHPRQYEFSIGGGEMVDGKWQPNKKGLGLGKVLDYIGVKYD